MDRSTVPNLPVVIFFFLTIFLNALLNVQLEFCTKLVQKLLF